MARQPKEKFDPAQGPQLKADLQKIRERVGDHGYARATAKQFAPGGEYHPDTRRRRRYAVT